MNTIIISKHSVFDKIGDEVADSKSVTFIPSKSSDTVDIKKENIYIVLKNDVDSDNLYFITTSNQDIDKRVIRLSNQMEKVLNFPVPLMVKPKSHNPKIVRLERNESRRTSWYSMIARGESLGLGNVAVIEVGGVGDVEGFAENIVKIIEQSA